MKIHFSLEKDRSFDGKLWYDGIKQIAQHEQFHTKANKLHRKQYLLKMVNHEVIVRNRGRESYVSRVNRRCAVHQCCNVEEREKERQRERNKQKRKKRKITIL